MEWLHDVFYFVVAGAGPTGMGLLIRTVGHRWPDLLGWQNFNRLVRWGVVAPSGDLDDLVRQVGTYQGSLAGTAMIVTGTAIIVVGALVSGLAAAGLVAIAPSAEGWPQLTSTAAAFIGMGVGYPLAVRLAQRTGRVGPRYADVRQRRVADYRAPALRWPAVAVVGALLAVALPLAVLQGRWYAFVSPAIAAAAVVLYELHMWATARLPRMIVAEDPEVSRRCDDLLRAGVISVFQILELATVAAACVLQLLYVGSLEASIGTTAVRVAIGAVIVPLAGCLVAMVAILFQQERLGGTITGWAGRPMPE